MVGRTGYDKACILSRLRIETCKRPNSQLHILLPLKPVDTEEHFLLWPDRLFGYPLQLRRAAHTRIHNPGLSMLQPRKRIPKNPPRKPTVHNNDIARPRRPALQPVKRDSIHILNQPAAPRKQLVGEMAVEQDARAGGEVAQQWDPGAELVDEEDVRA